MAAASWRAENADVTSAQPTSAQPTSAQPTSAQPTSAQPTSAESAAAAEVLRYRAFTADGAGGNPAGVVLDASTFDDARMQATAFALGFSESAFLVPRGDRRFRIRYFSPLAEVAFCGHATIAAAIAYAERHGPGSLVFETQAGEVPVGVADDGASLRATLTSVEPRVTPIAKRPELLAALGWSPDDLDPALPPRVAFAGVRHPVIASATRDRLARLDYDFDRLRSLMADQGWTTVLAIHRESPELFHARNPFAIAGVVEDPATGAAAAALGGYLRELGLVDPPASITIRQGEDMGQPCRLFVDIPVAGGIRVSGSAASFD
jgi:PhzF family phenazine biosynthesis protein